MNSKIGFLVSVQDEALTLTIDREFLHTCGVGQWAKELFRRYPGPYKALVIDLGGAIDAKSTLFAELLHLRDAYQTQLEQPVTLRRPSARIKQLLEIMSMQQLFHIAD